MTSAPAIGFEYRPSRRLVQWCLAGALLALAAIASCGLPPLARMLLASAVVAAVAAGVRRVIRTDVIAVGLNQDGSWVLRRADGTDLAASLASSRVIGACVLLRLKPAGLRAQTVLLGPDNSDADIRRRLRMRLVALGAVGEATDP